MYRRQAERFEDGPEPSLRARLPWILSAAACAALALGLVLYRQHRQRAQDAALEASVARALRCVLPARSLRELSLHEAHLIQLAAYPSGSSQWLSGCVGHVQEASRLAEQAGRTGEQTTLRELADDLRHAAPTADLAPLLMRVHSALISLAPQVSLPESLDVADTTHTLDVTALTAERRLSQGAAKVAIPLHRDVEPALLVQGDGARLWCAFEPAAIRCEPVPVPIEVSPTTLAGTYARGARPLLFDSTGPGLVHDNGLADRDRVLSFDGAIVSTVLLAQGGYARADGQRWVIGPRFVASPSDPTHVETLEWFVQSRGPQGAHLALLAEPAQQVAGGQILWEQLFLRVYDDRFKLLMRPLEGTETITVFDHLSDHTSRVEGCRTARTTVVRYGDHLAFAEGTHFGPSGEVPPFGTLSCNGDTATVLQLDPEHARILRASCTKGDGCFSHEVPLDADAAPPDRLAAVDVAGKLLVVWSVGAGGLRLKLAEPNAFAAAKTLVLFDDLWDERGYQAERTLRDFELVSFGAHAALLLHTTRGLHVLRVEQDGRIVPWLVAHP